MMKNPIIEILNARTIQEVDAVVMLNWKYFADNPNLLELARHSKKRIKKVNAEIRKSWYPMMN